MTDKVTIHLNKSDAENFLMYVDKFLDTSYDDLEKWPGVIEVLQQTTKQVYYTL